MNNKRGQFYIVAAILIVLAISGLAGITTYANASAKPRTIQSMGSELKEEGGRIVDYGIYKQQDTTALLNDFTNKYADYFLKKTNNANVIFVYGNKADLKAVKYESISTGVISANLGNGNPSWVMETGVVNRTNVDVASLGGNNLRVTIFNKDYHFSLTENQMFYFVIVQEKEGEVYVEENS